jgi:hypothetical protein
MQATSKAAIATGMIAVATLAAALLTPPAHTGDGPTGADCRLMVQALRENVGPVHVIASDRACDWRRLGLRGAVDLRELPPYDGTNFRGSDIVTELEYSRWGTRAQVDVGTQWAELWGEGRLCTYQRLFGHWVRSGCEPSWIS